MRSCQNMMFGLYSTNVVSTVLKTIRRISPLPTMADGLSIAVGAKVVAMIIAQAL
ncbi:MAG: hypothetical protein WCI18_15100 [Pseudomonadota bacterium]